MTAAETPSPGSGAERPARRPAEARPFVAWGLAVLIAVALHVVWMLWLGTVPVRARSALPGVPEVVYVPTPEPAAGEAAPAVWSPSVFSLPSRAGFSGAMLSGEIGVRPPLAMPGESALYLDRPAPAGAGGPRSFTQGLGSSIEQVATGLSFRADGAPAFPGAALTGVVLRVVFGGELAGLAIREGDVPDLPAACREKSWEASAVLETDDEGRVKHVFLTSRSPSDAYSLELVRAMRKWRLGAASARSGRVTFRVRVPAATAAAASPGGPPP